MKKMLFVYNPMAGKEQISTHLSNIVQDVLQWHLLK